MFVLAGLLLSILTTQIPVASDGTGAWELGVRFAVAGSGRITAIRYWRLAGDPGPHIGHVWSVSGMKLAEVAFVNETGSGQQEQALPLPLSISAGSYIVSVNSPAGAHYAVQPGGFSKVMVNGSLSASSGAYSAEGGMGTFPAASTPTNYFRDLVFRPDGTVTVSADPASPGNFTATLDGFDPGTYVLGISLTDSAGLVTSASLPIVLPAPSTGVEPQ